MERNHRNVYSARRPALLPRRAAAALRAVLLPVTVLLSGCQTSGLPEVRGAAGAAPERPGAEPDGADRRSADEWGRQYDLHPEDKPIALNYATVLRGRAEYAQAAAVLQRLAVKFPRDMEVLGAYGKALADAGRLREAAEVLQRAHTPDRPNWSILSAQGSVADRLGDHEQAQAYYAAALKIAPWQPHVLSNLGLSYALAKKLPQAEKALQEAAEQQGADTRVRQNLSLVLALESKFDAAEAVARRDLSAKDAAANISVIRRMIARSESLKQAGMHDSKTNPASRALTATRLE